MRLRLQPTLVFEASTPMGARAIRALLALWRAALLSAAIFVVVEAGDYMEFQESLLRPAYRVAFRAAAGLERLPYQVGRAIPLLKAPSSVAFPCGLGRPNPIPMVPSGIAGPEGFG
ncbi:MAG TPA: hypothetical protein VFT46_01760, partial [Holophagaceae bacterium]|nr:hypothetical protein [Holophagaceae bacterium]